MDLLYVKSRKIVMFLLLVMVMVMVVGSAVQLSEGEGSVYKVGDSAGWTTIANVDYKLWAATKTFQPGDIILFVYNPQFHNVQQVTHIGYRSCNASSPIATHTTGNDSITITANAHHFFICGVPGHCQAGQKVDINVLPPAAPTPSVTLSPSPVPSAPAPSNAHSLYVSNGVLFVKLGLAVLVFTILTSNMI